MRHCSDVQAKTAQHPLHLCLQAKKVAQHLKKHKVTGVGYTDTDNPFGGCCFAMTF